MVDFKKLQEKLRFTIYSDGSCLSNPGPGGYAAIIQNERTSEEVLVSGSSPNTTNNRMELMSIICALDHIPDGSVVNVYSDSKYAVDGIESWLKNWKRNGWKTSTGKDVKNKDLWQMLDSLICKNIVICHWIKGHADNEFNNECDRIARKCASLQEHVDWRLD